MCSRYSMYSKSLFSIFTNLIQTEEKMHLPVAVCFSDCAFNEKIHKYCFHEWNVFLIYLFLWQTQKLSTSLFKSWEKRYIFACMISSKICYVACTINHAGKLICLCAYLHEHNRVGLIDKPVRGHPDHQIWEKRIWTISYFHLSTSPAQNRLCFLMPASTMLQSLGVK